MRRKIKSARTAHIIIKDMQNPRQKSLKIYAGRYWTDYLGNPRFGEPGKWGNNIDVEIADGTTDSKNEFKITVKRYGEILEVHDDLSILKYEANYVENIVNNVSSYISVEVPVTIILSWLFSERSFYIH